MELKNAVVSVALRTVAQEVTFLVSAKTYFTWTIMKALKSLRTHPKRTLTIAVQSIEVTTGANPLHWWKRVGRRSRRSGGVLEKKEISSDY